MRYLINSILFGSKKADFSSDFINIHVTNACISIKHVINKSNSFVNHTMPLCFQKIHMLYVPVLEVVGTLPVGVGVLVVTVGVGMAIVIVDETEDKTLCNACEKGESIYYYHI